MAKDKNKRSHNEPIASTTVQTVTETETQNTQGENDTMTPNDTTTTNTETVVNAETGLETKRIQRTVFDLKAFEQITLKKDVNLPKKPESIKEAEDMVGGSTEKLLALIHKGLVSETVDTAWDDMSGFRIVEEDGKTLGEVYDGQFADEKKIDLINAAVLIFAKMQGYDKSKTPEQKRALKEKAMQFLRDNPAMLLSLQS